MSDRLKYERFVWFHGRVRSGRHPNAGDLAEKFELSQRTAQRDIDFMRDRLGAPLSYDAAKKGYCYTDGAYELPSRWFSEDNVMALALAVRLASSIPDTGMKKTLCAFMDRLMGLQDGVPQDCAEGLSEKVSVKNIEYSRVDEGIFHEVVDALYRERPIVIAYHSPHTDKKTVRTVLPLHLVHYMGSWHIVAYCDTRKGLRDFALSRIKDINITTESVVLPGDLPPIKEYTRKHFGIMQGGQTKEVCLRFGPSAAKWMAEQVWHPAQSVGFEPDGSLTMRFPVADFREIKRRILSHGSDVMVVGPKELREEVKKEIISMAVIYKDL